MARRTYRYDPDTKQMVEVTPTRRIPNGVFEDNFVSPVDGSVITSQRKLNEHNAKNGVMQVTSEVESHWKEQEKKKADFYTRQTMQRGDRIEALKHAWDVHTRRR